MTAIEPEVLIETRGQLGLITLNRPRAINALTHLMVGLIVDALEAWRDDESVATVAIIGAGERGLCAGGDVIGLHRAATEGQPEAAASFWRDEYRMNAMIADYPKPVVAIQDGLVLGGGIGVSAHASHRVVTERSKLGFPEVTIGFVPDVGATWLLSRAPGASGIRLGLTAESVGAADAIYVGFSDHYVPSDRIPALLSALENSAPGEAIAILSDHPGASNLESAAAGIDDAFRQDSVSEIVDALRAQGAESIADGIGIEVPARDFGDPPGDQTRASSRLPHGGADPGVPGIDECAGRTGLRRGHPGAAHRQRPVAELAPRHPRGRDRRAGRRVLRSDIRRRPRLHPCWTFQGEIMTTIAFLGLGHMGGPMAANLVKAGHRVLGFDFVPAALDAAKAAGVEIVDSGTDAAAVADVVITMFPSGRARARRRTAAARTAPDCWRWRRPGRCSSTLRRSPSTRLARLTRSPSPRVTASGRAGVGWRGRSRERDARVHGRRLRGGLRGGARRILEAMGRRIVHCGGPGLGQAAKVCNNMILAISQIAVAEAFVLGERLGLDHQALFDVASNASGQCWALTTNCPVPGPVPTSPANRDYQPGFAGALMDKDLGLAAQAIDLTGVDAKLGRLAREIYREFAAGEGARPGLLGDHQHHPHAERDRSSRGDAND